MKVTYTAPTVVTGAMTGRRNAAVLATAPAASVDQVSVYPNPTVSNRIELVVQASRETAATLRLYDVTGRLVHQEYVRLYTGSNELRLGVRNALPAGMYQLTVPELHVSQKVALY